MLSSDNGQALPLKYGACSKSCPDGVRRFLVYVLFFDPPWLDDLFDILVFCCIKMFSDELFIQDFGGGFVT